MIGTDCPSSSRPSLSDSVSFVTAQVCRQQKQKHTDAHSKGRAMMPIVSYKICQADVSIGLFSV